MRLAIVGSTLLVGNKDAADIIESVLDRYRPEVVVSGGAVGIDSMAAEAARRRGIAVVEHFPTERSWARGFKPRNMKIADDCDRLVRIAARGAATYGSGWTRDYAQKIGKPTEEWFL